MAGPRDIVLPSRDDDPVAAGAATLIGGGAGRRARIGGHWWWTPLRVLLAFMCLTLLLGWAQKEPCRDTGKWQENYQYTRMCYSDVEALYFAERLHEGATPYYDHPVEYPVVVGAVMGFAAKVTAELDNRFGAVGPNDRPALFFDITALLLACGGLVALVCTVKLAGRRPWDAALFALAPALVLHAYTNWDLVAVAFTAVGMLAWARRSPVLAGVFLGLGTASKLYPVLLLVPLLALCWRAQRLPAWWVATGATVGAWLLVNLPVALTANAFDDKTLRQVPSGGDNAWTRFWRLNQERMADHDSLWRWVEQSLDRGSGVTVVFVQALFTLAMLALVGAVLVLGALVLARLPVWLQVSGAAGIVAFTGWSAITAFDLVRAVWRHDDGDTFWFPIDSTTGHTTGALNAGVALGTVAVMLGVVCLALYAPLRPRWPQLAFLALAGFCLVNKVYSPQYVVWLIPLAALARPRWPAFLVWQATECLVFLTRYLYLICLGNMDARGGCREGVDYGWFGGAVWLRDAALVALMGLVVREVLRPELDLVRRDGVDDPAGGVLDGAPDHPALAPGTA